MARRHLIPLCLGRNNDMSAEEIMRCETFLLGMRHTDYRAKASTTRYDRIDGGFTTPQRCATRRRDLHAPDALRTAVVREDDDDVESGQHANKERQVARPMVLPGHAVPGGRGPWASLQAVALRLHDLIRLKDYALLDKMVLKLRQARPGDADLMACIRLMQVRKMSLVKRHDEDYDDIERAIMDLMVEGNQTQDSGFSSTIMAAHNHTRLMLELLLVNFRVAWTCEQWQAIEICLTGVFQLLTADKSGEFAWYAGMGHTYKSKILEYLSRSCSDKSRGASMHLQRIGHLEKALAFFRQEPSADAAYMYYDTHLTLADIHLADGQLSRAGQHIEAASHYMTSVMTDWLGRGWYYCDNQICSYVILKARHHHMLHDDVQGAIIILFQVRKLYDRRPEAAVYRTRLQDAITAYQAMHLDIQKFQRLQISELSESVVDSDISDTSVGQASSDALDEESGSDSLDSCSELD